MEITPGTIMQAATLIFVVLAFAFGRGDKSSAKVDELRIEHDKLKEKQHEQALDDQELLDLLGKFAVRTLMLNLLTLEQ